MAAQRLLRLLYPTPEPESPKKKDEANRDVRNEEIHRRYEAGERVVGLAQEYDMTIQAIYKILRAKRR
jgi:Mor family transcriptional regulator